MEKNCCLEKINRNMFQVLLDNNVLFGSICESVRDILIRRGISLNQMSWSLRMPQTSSVSCSSANRLRKIIKTLLGEKKLLLEEVHHRIKNNMACVSSFLSLQPKGIDTAAWM